MKSIFFLLFVIWRSSFCENQKRPEKFPIAQGEYARIDEVPYQASMIEVYKHLDLKVYCGATIIHKYWVLTAAHCVRESLIKRSVIRTGTDQFRGVGVRYNIDYAVQHPDFIMENYDNDIALIKLKTPIDFNMNQTSIPIATPTDIPEENQFMLISGFGRIGEDEEQSNILKKGYVPVTNHELCEKIYVKDPISDNMFCAGVGIVDACEGDSGGPGIINGKLYGIISTGEFCASPWFPGTYTSVHLYYDWIIKTTGINF